jgi:diguanylate cyclase (GGDEF)-like protein
METMDKIHKLVADILGEQMKLSDNQAVLMQRKSSEISNAFWAGFLADSLLLLMIYLLIHGEMRRRVKVEKELDHKSDLLRLVLNNMKDAVIAADSEGGYLVVNPAAENMLGVSPAQMPALGEWADRVGIFHPDAQTPYAAGDTPLAKVLGGQECDGMEVFLRNSNVPKGLFLSVNGRPLRDKEGRVIGGIVVHADVTEKKKNEQIILKDNEILKQSLERMEQHNREITLLANIVESLQACLSVEEAAKASANVMKMMFPGCSGRILSLGQLGTQMETMASFGSDPSGREDFPLDECWAMRRNQVHWVTGGDSALPCNHLLEPHPKEYFCVPLAAQGKLLGMFHVASAKEGRLGERQKKLAVLIGEQVSLAFANIGLRETLQIQSIRDPLTGLFNRRYMEGVLQKEVGLASKNNHKLSALMIDIDFFKRFNDQFGHDAGDAVLEEVGLLLKNFARKNDTACRYGGEELVLISPFTGPEEAREMGEKVREAVKEISIRHRETLLGAITVSVGVATCPDDGVTVDEFLKAADNALYQAKASGRDKVVAWRDIHSSSGITKILNRKKPAGPLSQKSRQAN